MTARRAILANRTARFVAGLTQCCARSLPVRRPRAYDSHVTRQHGPQLIGREVPRDAEGHDHRQSHDVPARVLAIAFFVTFGFLGVEALVGWWSGSLALLADAGHMLADAGALGLALWAQRWAARPRSARSTYGWRRAEVLAAFVNGVLLAVTALFIILEAIERFYHPRAIVGSALLAVAVLGLLVNLCIAKLLMRGREQSVNVRAAFAHVLTDALGSVGAIGAGICVMLLHWTRADPLFSIAIAVLVAFSGWRVLKETTSILLEAVPTHLDPVKISHTILQTPGVARCADLHVWSISDSMDAVSAHVVLEPGAHGVEVCDRVAGRVRTEHAVALVTIQPLAPAPNSVVPLRRSLEGGVAGPMKK
jgi:cobalt-zinc-cadmium efflux system protein